MPALGERRVVFLVGAVQFINILDFAMVMPLGPDFARALHIPMSQMGIITGGYTAAAAIVGFLGSFFLDRFDRRTALAIAMLGLGLGTAAGGFATDLHTLVGARVVAGIFGGPATSLAYSIIADVIPKERRGRAMGAVAGALSVAQVVGIPAGIWLAGLGSWRSPFFVVAGMGLLVTLGAFTLLPPMRMHLEGKRAGDPVASLGQLLRRRTVIASYTMTALVMASGFLLLPNVPTWIQQNLHYPRNHFQWLYIAGGAATFITNRLIGRLVDKLGAFRVGATAAVTILVTVWLYFVAAPAGLPVMAIFVTFAVMLGARNVAYNSLTTQVPRPHERARFLSLQSTVYHIASSLGAWGSSWVLEERADHTLDGMARLAGISMMLTALFPLLLLIVEGRVRREREPDKASTGAAAG